ncbi:MAG: exodeoxyribonuclease III [Alphaproteobacteria bacterium]|nr:exodeoxyribonuclease III [Alphaproteobacteria bacterium]MBV8548299.1 exodeoxyribonuclease III [Alphaproteobacteria bacterium]
MKIATWNVNSVRARLSNITDWLKSTAPDVLVMQEIKCETDAFPAMEFQALGYKTHVLGQKSYNGVALLSREAICDVQEGLPLYGGTEDLQARYIEATISGVRIANLYLPNGNPMDTDKYAYKLAWMKRLHRRMGELLKTEMPVVLAGDYNIIPAATDVYDPKGWEGDALYHPKSRAQFQRLLALGYTEAFRALHPKQEKAYTFWDYQAGAWPRNNGLRIDHFLLSPEAADRMVSCTIDALPRAVDKASDHTPVILELR